MTATDNPINISRRSFFRGFFSKSIDRLTVIHEEFHGRPQMRLDDLDQFPDEVLQTITPMFNCQIEWQLRETCLCVRYAGSADFVDLLPLADGDSAILCLFNQGHTLKEIARLVATDGSPDVLHTYPQVKTLFLILARCAVCHPAESLVDARIGDY